ncbi:MAG: PhoH family protein [Phycisphaeraceae bacterium]|nr:MAG: PhoH family protein [Phycisphaeraceae bacterium]
MIREALGVRISARDDTVHVMGDREAVFTARTVLDRLGDAARRRRTLSRRDVLDLISEAGHGGGGHELDNGFGEESSETEQLLRAAWDDRLDVYAGGRPIVARSENQQRYLDALRDHDLVFAIGPAGTGKTYLAVAAAVHLLKAGRLKKVVLVRPAVEAGEKLGFLPGDMEAKVNPYLRPLFDALHDMMDFSTIKRFMLHDVVEVAPLAFMRGRTLNDAVIILDEAQNTTKGQMKMFLTRMGQRSKMIVTGDVTQIDLPDPRESGLIDAAKRLRRVEGVAFVSLDRTDIVRHALVQRIVDAYGDDANRSRTGLESDIHVDSATEPDGA